MTDMPMGHPQGNEHQIDMPPDVTTNFRHFSICTICFNVTIVLIDSEGHWLRWDQSAENFIGAIEEWRQGVYAVRPDLELDPSQFT